MSEDSLETPEADAVEQKTDAAATPDGSAGDRAELPLEADPADAVDQTREIETDETEDYR